MKKKVPLFCKIRNFLHIPSPSAMLFCPLGFHFRPTNLCKKCPMREDYEDYRFIKNIRKE